MNAARKLGRVVSRHDPRTLRFADYHAAAVAPAPPPARDWSGRLPADVGLYDNDELGDCTCVATAHLMRTWRSQHNDPWVPRVGDIVRAYQSAGGYRPGHPETDNGAQMLDVLKLWRTSGIAGQRITAFVKLAVGKVGELQSAINLFGGIYVGLSLPLRAQSQVAHGVWDVPTHTTSDDEAGGWGGHAVACVGYDRTGVKLLTWGKRQLATWEWVEKYLDEAYGVLDAEWCGRALLAPNGFDLAALTADLAAVGTAVP